jgi:hypothetical protein
MIFEIGWLEVIAGLVAISFVQGIGYAAATAFFQRKFEKHFEIIEDKLKSITIEETERKQKILERRERFRGRLKKLGGVLSG